jgi:hypothetical protein
MNSEKYRKLIYEFCDYVGLTDPLGLLENNCVTVDGVDMLMMYDEKINPDVIHLRIDFGGSKGENMAEIRTAMLEANYGWGLDGNAVFSVHPQAGHAILTLRLPLTEDTNAARLAQALDQCAQEAQKCWSEARLELNKAPIPPAGNFIKA